LTGIIDRVDTSNQYYRVIDYKSADKSINFDEWYHGLSLQLPVYIAAYKNAYPEMLPIDAAYFQFKYPIIKYENENIEKINNENAKKVNNEYKYKGPSLDCEELLAAAEYAIKIINKSVQKMLTGEYSVKPKKIKDGKVSCRYCEYGGICGFEELNDQTAILEKLPLKINEEVKTVKKGKIFIEEITNRLNEEVE